jgi:hypothetical protein
MKWSGLAITKFVAAAVSFLFVSLPTCQTGHAAQLIAPPKGTECTIELQGELGPEDDKLFGESFPPDFGSAPGSQGPALCLDSVGGSYDVALKIAERLLGAVWIRTVVLPGQRCLSACALIFMAGNNTGEGGTNLSRTLFPGGDLGFHAPYLAVPKGNYDENSVNLAYSVATQQIGRLVRFSMKSYETNGVDIVFPYEAEIVFPNVLLEATLVTSKDSLVHIDTVMSAILAQIEVAFSKDALHNVKGAYRNACDNYVAAMVAKNLSWSEATEVFRSIAARHIKEFSKTINKTQFHLFVGYPGSEESLSGCLLVVTGDEIKAENISNAFFGSSTTGFGSISTGVAVNNDNFIALTEGQGTPTALGNWFILPFDTKIASVR